MNGIARAFASELLKLRSLRRIGLLCFSGVAALAAVITVATAGSDAFQGPANNFDLTLEEITGSGGLGHALSGASTLIGVVALSLTAWGWGQEYSNRTLQGLLVRLPRKLSLLAGKLGATLALVAVGIAIGVLVAAAAAAITAVAQGFDTGEWWTAGGLSDAAWTGMRVILSGMAWSVGGACLAVLLRSPVAAIGVGLAYALPLETLFTQAVDGAERWMPGSLLNAFVLGGDQGIGLGRSALVAAVEIAILAAVTAWVFTRRVDDA